MLDDGQYMAMVMVACNCNVLWIVDRCNYEFMNTVNIFWYYLTYIIIIITSVEWAISEYFSAFFQFNRIDIESTLQFFVFIMRT